MNKFNLWEKVKGHDWFKFVYDGVNNNYTYVIFINDHLYIIDGHDKFKQYTLSNNYIIEWI